MDQHQHWIVTADARRVTLFACRRLPGGGMHVDQLRAIANAHEAEHERGRPSLLGGAERHGAAGHSSARAGPQSAAAGHGDQEEHLRFAREVKGWFDQATRDLGLKPGRVHVFAAPRFLGVLRDQLGDLVAKADVHEGELARLAPQELADHPAVLRALQWPTEVQGGRAGRLGV